MTYEDICREFDKIHDKYFELLKDRLRPESRGISQMRRYMLKHKAATDVLFKPITFKVDSNTTYYAIPKIPDYKFFMKNGPSALTFLTYNDRHGLMAVMRVGYNDDEYLFATPHFFDRFIERFLDENVSKSEAMCQFFSNNTNFVMTAFPIPDNPNNLIGIADEAVLFGERIAPNITFARTCITRDMLYSNQVEATNILDDGIKLMIEDREKLKELLMKPSTSRFNRYDMI
jgi:hypothetical protein